MAYRAEIVRIEKWINNTKGDYIPKKTEGLLPSMTAQMINWTSKIVGVEQKTKVILSEAGASTILNPFYLSFAREVMTAKATFKGAQLLEKVDEILNKWTARSLDTDILERIRNSIFTLAAPTS